jgi:3-oxoacyl-[acyl-carrier protein] reductase
MSTEMQSIVVTGASGDIGLGIIERLVRDGFRVAACCRNRPDRVTSTFNGQQNVVPYDLDLRDETSIRECAGTIIKDSSTIAGLVNCAGLATGGLFAMTRMKDMRDLFEVNLFGPLLFCQYITKKMMRQKSGSIVNITSTAGILADPGTLAYGGSKAALGHASRVMASELGPMGIRVNAVAPSVVASDMANRMDEAARVKVTDREALAGATTPADIADTVSYLLSDRAAAISGQIIRVDRAMPF